MGKNEKITRHTPESAAKEPSRTDWERLKALSDAEITRAAQADPDARPVDGNFFDVARRVPIEDLLPKPKPQITLRLDEEVLTWFRKGGKGYQTRINAVLKAYVSHQKGRGGESRG